MMASAIRRKILSVVPVLTAFLVLGACGGGSNSSTPPPPVPVIQNLNDSTLPSSPVGLPLEIGGTGFQSAPGQVNFTQGSLTATVTPNASGWSSTGIVVDIPSGNGTTNFTVPGTISVSVTTTGGTSNSLNLTLVQTVNFAVNNLTWTQTTALPTAMSGMGAVAVPGSASGSAFVVVAGGYDGTKNNTTVLANTIAPAGTLGANWNAITTNPLPSPRAFAGMAEADPGNSLVSANSRFIYVIAGQQTTTDLPGGTSTVFMASVDPGTGIVGPWTQLANNLPVSLVGPGVTLFNGYVYVVGGLQTSGIPSSAVYSAPVNSDGSLGAWTTSPNSYSVTVAFPSVFGFGGNLYVANGDSQNETNPSLADIGGVTNVNYAPAIFGAVGAWTSTSSTVKNRSKQIIWLSFGQIIDAEGTYNGTPSCCELEHTTVDPDSTLAAWNQITNSINEPGANVYNAAAIVSPLLSPSNTPRFLLLGGETFVQSGATFPTNPLSATVYVNNAP